MVDLITKTNPVDYRMLFISLFCGAVSIFWQFWLIFEIALCAILIIYFSRGLRDLLNIHSVVVGLIVLYSFPSTILILQGKIELSDNELLMFFSAIGLALVGYTFSVLLFERSFSFEK